MGKITVPTHPKDEIFGNEAQTILGDIVRQEQQDEQETNFVAIENSDEFRKLIAKKKAFLIPSTISFLSLYIVFNLLISYTDILDKPFLGAISWVWFFAIGLFLMTWVFVTVYMRKAAQFDKMATETLERFNDGQEVGP